MLHNYSSATLAKACSKLRPRTGYSMSVLPDGVELDWDVEPGFIAPTEKELADAAEQVLLEEVKHSTLARLSAMVDAVYTANAGQAAIYSLKREWARSVRQGVYVELIAKEAGVRGFSAKDLALLIEERGRRWEEVLAPAAEVCRQEIKTAKTREEITEAFANFEYLCL